MKFNCMWPLNIRWRSCTKMCYWLRGITLSSNQYFATSWFWWLTPISAKGACIAWYWSLYLNVFVYQWCEVIDKAPLWITLLQKCNFALCFLVIPSIKRKWLLLCVGQSKLIFLKCFNSSALLISTSLSCYLLILR